MELSDALRRILGDRRGRFTKPEILLEIMLNGPFSGVPELARRVGWDRSQLRRLLSSWADEQICLYSRTSISMCPQIVPDLSPICPAQDVEEHGPYADRVPDLSPKSPQIVPALTDHPPIDTSTTNKVLIANSTYSNKTALSNGYVPKSTGTDVIEGKTQISLTDIWGDVSESSPPKAPRRGKKGTVNVYFGRHARQVEPVVRGIVEDYSDWRERALGKPYRPVKVAKELRAAKEFASQLDLGDFQKMLQRMEPHARNPRHRYLHQWMRSLSTLAEYWERLDAWRPFGESKKDSAVDAEHLTENQKDKRMLDRMSKAERQAHWDSMISGGGSDGKQDG